MVIIFRCTSMSEILTKNTFHRQQNTNLNSSAINSYHVPPEKTFSEVAVPFVTTQMVGFLKLFVFVMLSTK